MTVEFSNTSAAVWNAIQIAISNAGFNIAIVRGLDKQQGSFNSQTTTTAVKQDLVITCYKRKHSKKCTFYTLRFGCSFAAVNTIKPQLL